MKRALALLLFVAVSPAFAADWRNTLQPKGTPAAPITLVRDGKPAASIIIPANATPVETSAAADLQRWVREIAGAELSISQKSDGDAIRLVTDPAFEPEQYRIAADAHSITLAGSPGRGLMN